MTWEWYASENNVPTGGAEAVKANIGRGKHTILTFPRMAVPTDERVPTDWKSTTL